MKISLCGPLLPLRALCVSLCLSSVNAAPPNILYIMSDDHAAHAISVYGGRFADIAPTPNLDRIAREGMRFTNAFVTNSICTPSRAVIMTGKYSHLNGVYKFTGLDQSQPTLPKYLHAHGYQTGFVGKWHLQTNPRGFDWWSVLPGQGKYHNTEFVEMADAHPSDIVRNAKKTAFKGSHSTDIITKKALEFLKQHTANSTESAGGASARPATDPFFFMLHYKAPHDLWQHAHRYDNYLADTEIPEPDNLFDHGSGRSSALDQCTQDIGGTSQHTLFNDHIKNLEGEDRRRTAYQEYMKRYLRCVKGIDDNLGKVLAYLDDSGLAENTVVVYTADQGFFLGEHGMYDKRFMYEEALRVPLLVRWPGVVDEGSVNEEIVLNLDFAPTLLDIANWAGAQRRPNLSPASRWPGDMQGRSFLPLLKGEPVADWRDAFYYRYYFSHFNLPSHYGVRTKTHKLIYFDGIDDWELYDLEKDPSETQNLAGDPESAPLLAKLKKRLHALQNRVKDDPADIGDHPRPGNPALDAAHGAQEARKAKQQAK